jgi:methionyl-tRNA formyltransferase
MKNKLTIVFFGTPAFAIPSLDILIQSEYDVAGVVTSTDKPAGRGQTIRFSPVKDYALSHQLNILQPASLKSEDFINELRSLQANLFIVVAFRMLPEVVWKMPSLGTFNLHASLLPNYRGAAPINWAIINGETETGVTTFFIDQKIDTGKIIMSEKIAILANESAGELHDKLMVLGANLVLKTVQRIEQGNYQPVLQEEFIGINTQVRPAPKIFKEDCKINWSRNAIEVFNLIRGLSPYPAAFSDLKSVRNEKIVMKIFKATLISAPETFNITAELSPGTILTDSKNYVNVSCNDGFLSIMEIQIEGKRRMKIQDFLRGFHLDERQWKFD